MCGLTYSFTRILLHLSVYGSTQLNAYGFKYALIPQNESLTMYECGQTIE